MIDEKIRKTFNIILIVIEAVVTIKIFTLAGTSIFVTVYSEKYS